MAGESLFTRHPATPAWCQRFPCKATQNLRGRKGLPVPSLETGGPKKPGNGLGGPAECTHRRSRRCAAAATYCPPVGCRAKSLDPEHHGISRNAGRRPVHQRGARRDRRAGALARDGSRKRARRRRRVGWEGNGRRLQEHGATGVWTARNRPLRLLCCRLLPPPALRSVCFRGHAEGAAAAASQSPVTVNQV